MEPRQILRVEGLAIALSALTVYLILDGPIWLLVVLALAPDLGMLGYLVGPKLGSLSYNTVHTYSIPLLLAGLGFVADIRFAYLIALIWIAHIGVDRLFGYGLKYETGFTDTHLSSHPLRLTSVAESSR